MGDSGVSSSASLLYISSLVNNSVTGPHKPYFYLLEIDNTKILLDCGADVSIVLCSHASLEFIGGLPLILSILSTNVSIYMTLAAQCMARILFADIQSFVFARKHASEDEIIKASTTQAYSPAVIDYMFKKITTLRYSQFFQINNIIISPFAAGASLGGAYWRIRKGTEDIIYAVGISTKKERHLDPCHLIAAYSQFRPSVFITDSDVSLSVSASRKARDTELIELISLHLKSNNGDVLVLCPVTGKTLELILLLDAYWQQAKPPSTQLIIAGTEACRLVDFAHGMLEWMGDSVMKAFNSTRENPFTLKHTLCVPILGPKNPSDRVRRVVLLPTTDEHLQVHSSSTAMKLFIEQFSQDSRNLVIFTSTSPADGSISYELKTHGNLEKVLPVKCYHRIEISPEESVKIKKMSSAQQIEHDEDVDGDESEDESNVNEDDGNYFESSPASSKDQPLQKQSFTLSMLAYSYKDKKKRLSAYGEILDPADWPMFSFSPKQENVAADPTQSQYPTLGDQLSMLGVLSSDPRNAFSGGNSETSQDDSYCRIGSMVLETTSCVFKWTDFFIKSDGRSLRTLLSQLLPKKLVLAHGNQNESTYLSQWYKLAFDDDGHAENHTSDCTLVVEDGCRVNISVLTNMFHVTLSEALMSSLIFHASENVDVARITGKILERRLDDHSGPVHTIEPEESEDKDNYERFAAILDESLDVIITKNINTLQIISGSSLVSLKTQIDSTCPYLDCNIDEDSSTISVQRGLQDVAQISKTSRGEFNIFGDLSPDFLTLKKLVNQQALKL